MNSGGSASNDDHPLTWSANDVVSRDQPLAYHLVHNRAVENQPPNELEQAAMIFDACCSTPVPEAISACSNPAWAGVTAASPSYHTPPPAPPGPGLSDNEQNGLYGTGGSSPLQPIEPSAIGQRKPRRSKRFRSPAESLQTNKENIPPFNLQDTAPGVLLCMNVADGDRTNSFTVNMMRKLCTPARMIITAITKTGGWQQMRTAILHGQLHHHLTSSSTAAIFRLQNACAVLKNRNRTEQPVTQKVILTSITNGGAGMLVNSSPCATDAPKLLRLHAQVVQPTTNESCM